jgi:site-specific DNA-methyltransferase (adenine-specific)
MITVTNEDNLELMARYPDKHFDLAIVDPPYGININMNMGLRKGKSKNHETKKWDAYTPDALYFNELFRVSKHQIIWGGNYFELPLTKSWIFWDKIVPEGVSFADGELAWTSFDKTLVKAVIPYSGFRGSDSGGRIHPTQKPVALYKWLLSKYATTGQTILDTHLGSGSIAIACHDMKFNLTACELDTDYYNAAMKRITDHQKQLNLF